MMGDPEAFDENIDLNYDAAAVGGAKLFIDQTRTTRSISKKSVLFYFLNCSPAIHFKLNFEGLLHSRILPSLLN